MRVPLLVDSDLAALVFLGVLGCITMLVVQKAVTVSAKITRAGVTFPKTAVLIVRVAGLGQGLSGGEKARQNFGFSRGDFRRGIRELPLKIRKWGLFAGLKLFTQQPAVIVPLKDDSPDKMPVRIVKQNFIGHAALAITHRHRRRPRRAVCQFRPFHCVPVQPVRIRGVQEAQFCLPSAVVVAVNLDLPLDTVWIQLDSPKERKMDPSGLWCSASSILPSG